MSISLYPEEDCYNALCNSEDRSDSCWINSEDSESKVDLVTYCKGFINSHFYGERAEKISAPRIGTKRKISLSFNPSILNKFKINTEITEGDTLGSLLKLFHLMLTSKECEDDRFYGTEDIIFQHLIAVAALRKKPGEKTNSCFKRLLNDCQQFLKIYDKYAATREEVMESHWGSSQQLRSGKVIADFVNGPGIPKMDPVFGVLLCPYAGQIKENSSSRNPLDGSHPSVTGQVFDEATAYHRVMLDAFHFLEEFHKIGPGCDYLGAFTLFHPDPLSGEETSRLFWQRQFNRITEEGLTIKETYF